VSFKQTLLSFKSILRCTLWSTTYHLPKIGNPLHTLPTETDFQQILQTKTVEIFLRSITLAAFGASWKTINGLESETENTLIVFFWRPRLPGGGGTKWRSLNKADALSWRGCPLEDNFKSKPCLSSLIFIQPWRSLAAKNVPDYLEGESFLELFAIHNRQEVRTIIARGEMLGRSVRNATWSISSGEKEARQEVWPKYWWSTIICDYPDMQQLFLRWKNFCIRKN
jgi:hypothetical protein